MIREPNAIHEEALHMSDSNKRNVEVRLDLPYGGGPQGNLCVDI
jgi:hypothetical protein